MLFHGSYKVDVMLIAVILSYRDELNNSYIHATRNQAGVRARLVQRYLIGE